MDYKETLNLPKTDFPMKADLVAREPERLAAWERNGLYRQIQEARANRPAFILHDGPPFANGDLHIGHVLNKILKDAILKYKSLRGHRAPYVPGWDCHGLPIEFKVSQELRKSGDASSDSASVRKACDAYARKYIEIQRQQFKRLGVLGDWEHPYLTLNKEYEADELRLFAEIVEKGFVYRGKKPVYWSIPCRTALAEAEVEYRDHISQSVYVKFPLAGAPGRYVLIWTTTPWTLPANLAVAFNSTFDYAEVAVGAETYLVSTALLSAVAAQCGWSEYKIVRSLPGRALAGLRYEHPFIARRGQFFAGDSFVENSTGTGFVHIAPGHGLEDYGLGAQHGLPIYSPVDNDGRFAHTGDLPIEQQMPAELLGKPILAHQGRSEANEAVLEILQARGALVHRQDYSHSYPHCWRSKTPVIFRAMDQWFIKIDHDNFRSAAIAAIDRVQWIPDWGRNRIEGAVKARPDWCISRQRSWGVPIPVFYDAENRPILEGRIIRAAADLIEQQGSNIWFELPVADLWERLKPADWSAPEPVAKSADTLDVWIDSGSSSRAVLRRRTELQHPAGAEGAPAWQADLYLEGSDQHRGWFQSSLLLSLAASGQAPFRGVLTHGFIVNADKEKISKSQQSGGAYEKPQTSESYVKKWGADVLRLWVASQDFRNDVVVSEERIQKVSETYRLLRNTLRYQLSNLFDFSPDRDALPDASLTGLDRWILGLFGDLEKEVADAYDKFEFHIAYQKISQFVAIQLSAVYHDIVKDRLYTDPAGSPRRRSTQTTLFRLASGLCKMFSPVLAFTADEAWTFLPGARLSSVHLAEWSPTVLARSDQEKRTWNRLFELRELALPEIEKKREAKLLGKALEASVTLKGPPAALAEALEYAGDLRELLNVSALSLEILAPERVETPPPIQIVVEKAPGQKCARCWHWEMDVGADASHPLLCGRCVRAVSRRS